MPVLDNFLAKGSEALEHLRHIQPTCTQALVGGVISWIAVVRLFRWRHYNEIHRRYSAKWINGEGTITPEEAQIIFQLSSFYDLPALLNYAVSFALFKTYGIPAVSKLLIATKQLSSDEAISRRYADTDILISTWLACPISGFLDPEFARLNRLKGKDAQPAEDPRSMLGLARVNWLHSQYKIPNEQYLYTLALFIIEPAKWAKLYGWRQLSALEQHSYYVLWKEIGKRMNIQDIPGSFEEIWAWSEEYEKIHMLPAKVNQEMASYTMGELLSAVPEAFGLKKFMEKLSICLLEDRVRVAMMFPEQSQIYHTIINIILRVATFTQGWLLLPRRSMKANVDTTINTFADFPPRVCPRMHPNKYAAKPWYRAESIGLGYYWDKFLILIGFYTEMPGPHLKSGGYRIEEMGPFKFENSAHEEIMQRAAELQGCPVVGPWSLEGRQKEA